jgi:hypothetical protein
VEEQEREGDVEERERWRAPNPSLGRGEDVGASRICVRRELASRRRGRRPEGIREGHEADGAWIRRRRRRRRSRRRRPGVWAEEAR